MRHLLRFAVSCGSSLAAALAADAMTALVPIDYDSITLTNGSAVHGRIQALQDDGSVRLKQLDNDTVTVIPKTEIRAIERKRTLAESITMRGDEAIRDGEWLDVQRTLRVAISKAKDDQAVRDAGIALAKQAMAKRPSSALATIAIPLFQAAGDNAGILAIAKAGLAADPTWTPGFEIQAQVLRQQGDDAGLRVLLAAWLEHQPTALAPNRVIAESRERGRTAEDLSVATEAYRKGFELHKDPLCGVGHARCSLRRGDVASAERSARAVLTIPDLPAPLAAQARLWLGAAILANPRTKPNALGEAQAALEQALKDGLENDDADIARYDLGIILMRGGKTGEAAAIWKKVVGPEGSMALAVLAERPIEAKGLPQGLLTFSGEYNNAIKLMRGDAGTGDAGSQNPRSPFQEQIAQVLSTNGDLNAVRGLTAYPGVESLRWQAYGHLLQARNEEVASILDKLPKDDGWAISVRIYLAVMQKNDSAAREWMGKLGSAKNTPKDYAQLLVAEFSSAQDELIEERFNWPDREAVAIGWVVTAPATGIAVRAAEGKLLLGGTQEASAVTSAYRLVKAQRVRSFSATFDISGAKDATVGLEFLTADRSRGVEIGLAGGSLCWRSILNKQPGAWNKTKISAKDASRCVLGGAFEGDRLCLVVDGEKTPPVAASVPRDDLACIGIFGVANSQVAWKASADDLVIQLKPK